MANIIDSRNKTKVGWHVLRVSLALLGLFCCYRLTVGAASAGLARLLSTSAIAQSKVGPADAAIRLAPADPEAHYTRALALVNLQRLDDAVAELQQATQLRPHHYYEWLDLGVTLDRLADQKGAEAALKESVRLAPFFAQPRWQLGNLFFRQERYQEAFTELRLGAKSNPSLFGGMVELAWVAANGDVVVVESLVQPQSSRHHLELASFLAKQGKPADAARQVREAGSPEIDGERTLLHQTIDQLLASHQYSDAYDAWAATHSSSIGNKAKGEFLNGNFEDPIRQDDPGFGWQVSALPTVTVSIDLSGPTPSARSLRLEFGGDSATGSQVIHQLVLLQPNTRYSLGFLAKVDDLVSGGPPVLVALAAGTETTKVLGQSEPISRSTSEWSPYKVDFSTDDSTSAVVITLQRLACKQSPCPIFGKLWLSGFSLAKP